MVLKIFACDLFFNLARLFYLKKKRFFFRENGFCSQVNKFMEYLD